jgi:DNA-binding HxlR family transcriptional regulator
MKQTSRQYANGPAAAVTLSLINSKWKLLILRCLHTRPRRFNELKNELPGISQKMLTDSLRALQEDGLILRTVWSDTPLHVEYALSETGKSLWPVLLEMEQWALYYARMREQSGEGTE